ncbi:hypothetical protein [Ralstonia phage RP13]|nr:hypothetical protein [Ralstonia phage RP13]BCG50287.1 hypothetical protein [Ralstonia phage RP13]
MTTTFDTLPNLKIVIDHLSFDNGMEFDEIALKCLNKFDATRLEELCTRFCGAELHTKISVEELNDGKPSEQCYNYDELVGTVGEQMAYGEVGITEFLIKKYPDLQYLDQYLNEVFESPLD